MKPSIKQTESEFKKALLIKKRVFALSTAFWIVLQLVTHVRMNVDSYDSLRLGKTLTFNNVIIYIKSVNKNHWSKSLNKDQNQYYYNTFFQKLSSQLS